MCLKLMFALQISADPKVYVYDTPGIMLPHIPNMDVGMRLALCGNDAYYFTVVMSCFSHNDVIILNTKNASSSFI